MQEWREPHPLQGPGLKFKWASKHLDELDRIEAIYESSQPYSLESEIDSEKGVKLWRLRGKWPMFLDYGRELGEFLYQLRSGLDNLAWQLAMLTTTKPYRLTEFPIFGTENKGRFSDVTQSIQPYAIRIIEFLQPYKRNETVQLDPLWVLNAARNMDSHKLIVPTVSKVDIPRYPNITVYEMTEVNDGDVVMETPIDFEFHEDLEPKPSFQIGIRIDEWEYPTATLRQVYEYVRFDVFPRFAGFFPEPPDIRKP